MRVMFYRNGARDRELFSISSNPAGPKLTTLASGS